MKVQKLLSFLTMTVVVTGICPNTYGQVLHKLTNEQIITQGVVQISEEILTDKGWQDIQVLKINLQNEDIQLKPIESSTLGERKNILELAKSTGAIAAVNADFFDMGTSSGASFGPVIQGGEVYHSYNMNYTNLGPKKYMATFMIDHDQNVSMDYYGMQLAVGTDQGKLFDVATYNKLPGSLGRPVIIDSHFYKDNAKLIQKYQGEGMYSVVVEDGIVTTQSLQNEMVSVPENGFVIALNGTYANKYYSQLQPGTPVELTEDVLLNGQIIKVVEELQLGIGGGGLILKDGKAYAGNSHKVSGDKKEPRTVVATTYTPGEVLLITIDGRNNTLGANHQDLVSLLQEYGAKDAMYFDGGGSTTLVARNTGDTVVSLQNKPSGGSQRNVVNGLGVFTTAAPTTLNQLILEGSRERTFIEEGIKFSIKGVDTNQNPVVIDESQLNLSVTGVEGYWKGTTFYPTSEGKGLVVATMGDVTATQEIIVTAAPKGLVIEPAKLQLEPNGSKKVQVYGVDKEGYKIPLSSDKISWKSNQASITGSGYQISAQGESIGILTAQYKGAEAKMEVVVGNSIKAIESFETLVPKWAGDTTTVKGKVEPSKEVKYHGEQSIKMTYTFDKSTNKQVAYTVFPQTVKLPSDAYALNLWVHAKGQGDTLKVQITDAAGKTHYLKLADKLDHEGWKYLSAVIPPEVKLPAEVTKIYTYANNVEAKRTSAVYLDHMSITRGAQDGASLRKDYLFDSRYKSSLQAPTGSQYQLKVTGPTKMGSMVMGEDMKSKVGKNLSSNTDLLLQVSGQNAALGVKVPTYTYNNQFNEMNHKNVQMLWIGTDQGGIRSTNTKQWGQVKAALEASNKPHVILMMSQNPLTQFKDSREGKAFHDYLKEHQEKTGKNIFVITPGGYDNEVRLEDGITYMRLHGAAVLNDNIAGGTYLTFKIVDDQIYYTFEPMM